MHLKLKKKLLLDGGEEQHTTATYANVTHNKKKLVVYAIIRWTLQNAYVAGESTIVKLYYCKRENAVAGMREFWWLKKQWLELRSEQILRDN